MSTYNISGIFVADLTGIAAAAHVIIKSGQQLTVPRPRVNNAKIGQMSMCFGDKSTLLHVFRHCAAAEHS